jgi:hypothetical protein
MTDRCHFCGGEDAGYARRDEKGTYQDACFKCASKPYSQPEQLRPKNEQEKKCEFD